MYIPWMLPSEQIPHLPFTRAVRPAAVRITLTIKPDFDWSDRWSGQETQTEALPSASQCITRIINIFPIFSPYFYTIWGSFSNRRKGLMESPTPIPVSTVALGPVSPFGFGWRIRSRRRALKRGTVASFQRLRCSCAFGLHISMELVLNQRDTLNFSPNINFSWDVSTWTAPQHFQAQL